MVEQKTSDWMAIHKGGVEEGAETGRESQGGVQTSGGTMSRQIG